MMVVADCISTEQYVRFIEVSERHFVNSLKCFLIMHINEEWFNDSDEIHCFK